MDLILQAKGRELHSNEIREGNHHHLPSPNHLPNRTQLGVGEELIGSVRFSRIDQMDRITSCVIVLRHQHVDARIITESKAELRGRSHQSLKVASIDHQVDVLRRPLSVRSNVLDVRKNCKTSDKFIWDVVGRQRVGDPCEDSDQMVDAFFEHGVDQPSRLPRVTQKLFEGR